MSLGRDGAGEGFVAWAGFAAVFYYRGGKEILLEAGESGGAPSGAKTQGWSGVKSSGGWVKVRGWERCGGQRCSMVLIARDERDTASGRDLPSVSRVAMRGEPSNGKGR